MSGTTLTKGFPTYYPDGFSLGENYNVFQVSEIHAWEESDYSRRKYLQEVVEQINSFDKKYELDEVWLLGDTGSFEDVELILSGIEEETPVRLIAGDEDKKVEGERRGWFTDPKVRSLQPFDVSNDYSIYDEGFQTRVKGLDIQAAHHPGRKGRDDSLNDPDPRSDDFLDELFCISKDDNVNTLQGVPPRMEKLDIAVYDHVHMPYVREIEGKLVVGLGGRRFNYQRNENWLPERSVHLLSLNEEVVNTLHFDAGNGDIIEHLAFDREMDELFDVQASRYENQQSGYQPIQSRFHRDQYDPDAKETDDQILEFWESAH